MDMFLNLFIRITARHRASSLCKTRRIVCKLAALTVEHSLSHLSTVIKLVNQFKTVDVFFLKIF